MKKEDFIKSIALPGEVWKDVPNYERQYSVSTLGRVASFSNRGFNILKGEENNTLLKYLRVNLYKHCKREHVFIHRIVATVFIPNPNNLPFVDHIDGNPRNNAASNLRWCTRQENIDNPNTRPRHGKHTNPYNGAFDKPVSAFLDNKETRYRSISEAGRQGHFWKGILKSTKTGEPYHGMTWRFL